MKILVDFRPFIINQLIYVYDDDKVIDAAAVPLPQLINNISQYKMRYGVNQIDMYGNPSMLEKYKKELTSKYFNKITVNIFERS